MGVPLSPSGEKEGPHFCPAPFGGAAVPLRIPRDGPQAGLACPDPPRLGGREARALDKGEAASPTQGEIEEMMSDKEVTLAR